MKFIEGDPPPARHIEVTSTVLIQKIIREDDQIKKEGLAKMVAVSVTQPFPQFLAIIVS